ncbi:MAG: hypothetical protein ABW104_18705 [Candidatus Thiodiazotropha sp. 6PLUC2]
MDCTLIPLTKSSSHRAAKSIGNGSACASGLFNVSDEPGYRNNQQLNNDQTVSVYRSLRPHSEITPEACNPYPANISCRLYMT